MSRRLLMLINPAAGGGQTPRRWEALRTRMDRLRLKLVCEWTHRPGHAIELARSAVDDFDAIVAVGGDGTVNEVANGILRAGRPVALGILPLGTANDAATQLGIRSLDEAVAGLVSGVPRAFDTIEVCHGTPERRETHHALMFAAAGFGAELLRRTTVRVKRAFGPRLCYAVGFVRALWHYRRTHLQVRTDQGDFEGALFHVCAGNTEYAGGRLMRLSPGARADDGFLNLCVIQRLSRFEALRHLPKLIKGTHPSHPKVRYFSGVALEVQSQPQVSLALDGDVIGTTPATFRVQPRSLQVLVPCQP
jgi:YegS/Rv2252/BmrU family lipid kinase